MNFTMEQYQESAQALRARLGGFVPKVAMVLGLPACAELSRGTGERPHRGGLPGHPSFKASTAQGPAKDALVFGLLEGQRVAVMQGRMHHYEGYSYEEVSYAVRVLRLLGCDTLVVSNAAGCVNLEWKAGDLMLITDQIKMFSSPPPGRTCRSSASASPTPPTCTPRACGSWRGRRRRSWISLCGRACISIATVPSMRPRRRSGPPGSWSDAVVPPRRRPLAADTAGDGGAGADPAVQYGGGHPGPAPQRAGGAGRRGGSPGEILRPDPGLPEENVRSL